ncbi:MAG TPA: hypothetical protein VI483_03560 [Candidatus Paceibacterota bacterium]
MPNIAAVSSLQPPSFISGIPIDAIILIIFAVIVMIDAFRSGTRRVVVLTLTAPITLILYSALLNAAFIGKTLTALTAPSVRAGIVAATFVLVYIMIYRLVPPSFNAASSPLQAIVAGLAAATVLAVLWVQTPALMAMWAPSEMVQVIFGSAYRLYWLVGAFLILAFSRR